jgi:hypothetical protein
VSIVVTSCGQGVRGLHGGDRRDRQRDLHPRRRGSLRNQHQPQSAGGQLQPSLERSRTGTVGQRSAGSQLGCFIFQHHLFSLAGTIPNRWVRDKAVNREDKRSRRYRDRDFAKFERSRRYGDR